MEPLVSVIVPVYNVLPYLREALDSVINQTYKNLEIIIVDDGSTDGSGEVCDEYLSDPRVTVIHQENKGLSGARNTALDRMTGEYVAFLDSDDAFMPEMIDSMLRALIRTKSDLAVCGYTTCYTRKALSESGIPKTKCVVFSKETVCSSVEAQNLLITNTTHWVVWNKLYRRTVWTGIRFPEGANYEDMRVMFRVFELCVQVVTLPGSYVYYRRRHGSITRSQTQKNLQDHLLAIQSIENHIQTHTPDVFPAESIYIFLEHYARVLSDQYARMLMVRPRSAESLALFRKTTLHFWAQLEGIPCQLQSRVFRFLFRYAPVLILPARSCWRIGKKLLGRV